MRQHFALDALVNYEVEPAEVDRSIPNPERKKLDPELRASCVALAKLEQAYGQQARANREADRPTMRGFKIAQAGLEPRARASKCPMRTAAGAAKRAAQAGSPKHAAR